MWVVAYSSHVYTTYIVMRRKLIQYSILIVWMFFIPSSWATNENILSPLPNNVLQKWQNFELVGQTRLSRFGFHIYDSTFWIHDYSSSKKEANELLNNNTSALSITYARKIHAQKLLSSTKKEWIRLGFAEQYPLDAWLVMLANIWPDVNKGDQLIFVTTPDGKSTFYNKTQSLGTIDDPKFGSAFLAIWLDKNSRFKKNRKELLGE